MIRSWREIVDRDNNSWLISQLAKIETLPEIFHLIDGIFEFSGLLVSNRYDLKDECLVLYTGSLNWNGRLNWNNVVYNLAIECTECVHCM